MALGPKQLHERRQFGRRETNLHAWIRIPGRPLQACVVKDLSLGGAKLDCDAPERLPYRFELVIPSTHTEFVCEMRHCSGRTMGVMFCAPELHQAEAAPGNQRDDTWGSLAERTVRRPGDLIEDMKASHRFARRH